MSRLVVKYSYEAGEKSLVENVRESLLIWSLGTYAMACSTHVEAEVPFPLVIENSAIYEVDGSDPVVIAGADHSGAVHHLVAVPSSATAFGVWYSTVRVAESTATRAALFTSVATSLICAYLLVGTWGVSISGGTPLNLEPSTSLLLAVAGAVAPLVGREPRHWLVAKFVRPFRDVTTVAGTVLFGTALAVGTVPDESLRAWIQAVLLFVAMGLMVAVLTLRRRVSRGSTITR